MRLGINKNKSTDPYMAISKPIRLSIIRVWRLKRATPSSPSLLLGGGPAALSCAETLRQEGFTGRIVMIVKEKHLPYDRVKLSKELHVDASSLELRKKTFFDVRPRFGSMMNHVFSFKIQNAIS